MPALSTILTILQVRNFLHQGWGGGNASELLFWKQMFLFPSFGFPSTIWRCVQAPSTVQLITIKHLFFHLCFQFWQSTELTASAI